jgi:hypothetical protein
MRAEEEVAAAYMLGQRDALSAAREAVVTLCWRRQYEGFVSTVDPQRVLAAIDALRKDDGHEMP